MKVDVKVKICGITNYKDAEAACDFGADALGFVFSKSPRKISPEKAREIIRRLPPYVTAVGVFVNERKERVLEIAGYCRLDRIQLHGDESLDYCKYLKKYYKIIKAIRVGGRESLKTLNDHGVDAILLDTYVKGMSGGTGQKFDWDIAVKAGKTKTPLILSGGLDVNNIEGAIRKVRPYAVDASSGLESAPGKKDHGLMKKFIEKAKRTK